MNRLLAMIVLSSLAFFGLLNVVSAGEKPMESEKHTLKKGHLKVSDGHELYFEVVGNPKGIPVLFLHGGPGGGFSDNDKSYFNLDKYKVILFDQRGAGRSRPFASIDANTTNHLVADIDAILDFFAVEKVFLFGGSWGATLALVYAVKNPNRVMGMLLRAIWLCDRVNMDHFMGGGIKPFFPDVWKRFISLVPSKHRGNPAKYYSEQMQSSDEKQADRYAYEWANYEIAIALLDMPQEMREEIMKKHDYRAFARMESHYLAEACFLDDDFIMKNVGKIKHIPVSIIQGRYDMICPPASAIKLHKSLAKSRLKIVPTGHSAYEKLIHNELVKEMTRFESEL